MITDPLFYAVAVPAVVIAGLSKGGFGGAVGIASVPLLSLVIPPVQAAALMLPILLVMDAIALASFRRLFDRRVVLAVLPGGLLGTGLGWATASLVSDDAVRILVGGIAIAFLVRTFLARGPRPAAAGAAPAATARTPPSLSPGAVFWGSLAGYTSFVAHAGGPPYQAYVVPMRLEPVVYAGTSAVFFAILNAIKVIPYTALGQFDTSVLTTAAVLFPLAAASTWAGVRIVRRISTGLFYSILYVSIAVVAVKLVWDGVAGVLAG